MVAQHSQWSLMSNPKSASDLEIAKAVITSEMMGLEALIGSLDTTFVDAIDILAKLKGRVIATGMGKSGHIARKIASTFSSTGTPAHFVHPGEASHGDLGMISAEDAVLAISNSGETAELSNLLSYCRRFKIPVVAITRSAKSTLASFANTVIVLPDAEEACAETKAPTTSTTMTLAIGDALAVALLRRKQFSASEFHGFHPGGNLGAALKRVDELMHNADKLPLCQLTASLKDAVGIMTDGGFGCVGVIDTKGNLVGVITDGDLRRSFGEHDKASSVVDAMTKSPLVVQRETLAGDALALLSSRKITSLFIVTDGKPVGLLHVHDCLAGGVL